jgi:hypothetical protein
MFGLSGSKKTLCQIPRNLISDPKENPISNPRKPYFRHPKDVNQGCVTKKDEKHESLILKEVHHILRLGFRSNNFIPLVVSITLRSPTNKKKIRNKKNYLKHIGMFFQLKKSKFINHFLISIWSFPISMNYNLEPKPPT